MTCALAESVLGSLVRILHGSWYPFSGGIVWVPSGIQVEVRFSLP